MVGTDTIPIQRASSVRSPFDERKYEGADDGGRQPNLRGTGGWKTSLASLPDDSWADRVHKRMSELPPPQLRSAVMPCDGAVSPRASAVVESTQIEDDWADKPLATHPSKRLRGMAIDNEEVGGWAAELLPEEEDAADERWRITPTDYDDIMRWVEYARIGKPLAGTRIVPCKTPFEGPMAETAVREELMGDGERFDKRDLLQKCRERGTPVGMVIDLAYTGKYYEGFSKESDGVEYKKLPVRGHGVPPRWQLEEAFDAIDEFLARCPTEYVVVHCTHGVNRTGFFLAAYLMLRQKVRYAPDAMSAFQAARGERIDKPLLISALHQIEGRGWYKY